MGLNKQIYLPNTTNESYGKLSTISQSTEKASIEFDFEPTVVIASKPSEEGAIIFNGDSDVSITSTIKGELIGSIFSVYNAADTNGASAVRFYAVKCKGV